LPRKVEIRTKKQALQVVVSHVAGLLGADSLEEATGFTEPEVAAMSDAEMERLDWAIEEVRRRLYGMGGS
jgi:hypothetical protein